MDKEVEVSKALVGVVESSSMADTAAGSSSVVAEVVVPASLEAEAVAHTSVPTEVAE